MTPRTSSPRQDPAASRAIDAIIEAPGDWRSTTLARLRAVILSADASIVEEVKWKKPSRPTGVPVWSRDGNICIGEALKNAVRLTFPKGALLKDPEHVFNTRLDSATVRAAVGRTHRSSPEPHPQPLPQRPGVNFLGNSGFLPGDDFSDPREGPPGRCLYGLPTSRQYAPVVP
jgi:hypothetical protein